MEPRKAKSILIIVLLILQDLHQTECLLLKIAFKVKKIVKKVSKILAKRAEQSPIVFNRPRPMSPLMLPQLFPPMSSNSYGSSASYGRPPKVIIPIFIQPRPQKQIYRETRTIEITPGFISKSNLFVCNKF